MFEGLAAHLARVGFSEERAARQGGALLVSWGSSVSGSPTGVVGSSGSEGSEAPGEALDVVADEVMSVNPVASRPVVSDPEGVPPTWGFHRLGPAALPVHAASQGRLSCRQALGVGRA